jgi:CheY-like chemotaxis protein
MRRKLRDASRGSPRSFAAQSALAQDDNTRISQSRLKSLANLPMKKLAKPVFRRRLRIGGKDEGMTKILLVEDSKFLRMATERALLRAGYEVSVAVDGEQALELAKHESPHIILLDMLLPKLSGPDVLKALKKDSSTASIPVVVLSGLSQKNASKLQEDGAVASLEKSTLELEKGCGAFLGALAVILRQLDMDVPSGGHAQHAKAGS